jgi:phosphinothricin acetyltransferase
MELSMRIRPALKTDLAAIASIYSHYVRNSTSTFEIEPPGISEMTRRWSEIATKGFPYLVADISGAVAGYAFAGPYRTRRAYRFTVEDSVYVHPDHVGRGIGRALLGAVIDGCRAAGSQQMIAIIGDSANIASVRLHAAHEFRTVGTLESVGLKFGRWVDTVIMQRALQPDGAPAPSI